jgi:putative NADH-flavin reductase
MRVLVLGATGRVGSEAVRLACSAGHEVTAFVRDPTKFSGDAGVRVVVGDIAHPESLAAALQAGCDSVLNAVGVDPLKPSTFVTDSTREILAAMEVAKVTRYVAVSGTANMPEKTAFGSFTAFALGLTPVRHAMRDHRAAFEIVRNSKLDWSLAGCPWIKDGAATGAYVESAIFPGGFKSIQPGDVAHFLTKILARSDYSKKIIGIWNA